MDRYRKLKVIGKGSFGYAVLVQSVADRQTYVMKIIDVSKMDRKQREDAINEVSKSFFRLEKSMLANNNVINSFAIPYRFMCSKL